MTDTTDLISGRTLAEWQEFARRDDCLERMTPSDLRLLVGRIVADGREIERMAKAGQAERAAAEESLLSAFRHGFVGGKYSDPRDERAGARLWEQYLLGRTNSNKESDVSNENLRQLVEPLLAAAINEAGNAMQKFPQPNYVISKVAEEAGEVVKAAIHCAEGRETPENVVGEIRQAIAMLIRLYVEGDRVHGLAPLNAIAAADVAHRAAYKALGSALES